MECCIALLVPEVHDHRAALQQGPHDLHLAAPGGGMEEPLRPHPSPLSLQPRLHHPTLTLPYCYSHICAIALHLKRVVLNERIGWSVIRSM